MKATAEQILAPAKVPWQRVLGATIRGSVRARLGGAHETYDRRNRRRHNAPILGGGRRAVIPASVCPTPRIHVVRDTSGSMSGNELNAVTNEIRGISQRLGIRGDDLQITDWDVVGYGARNYQRPTDLVEVRGRGGTDMAAAVVAALTVKPAPTAVVVLTDGYTGWPELRPSRSRIPVVAAIISNPNATVPSWMRAVHIDL